MYGQKEIMRHFHFSIIEKCLYCTLCMLKKVVPLPHTLFFPHTQTHINRTFTSTWNILFIVKLNLSTLKQRFKNILYVQNFHDFFDFR